MVEGEGGGGGGGLLGMKRGLKQQGGVCPWTPPLPPPNFQNLKKNPEPLAYLHDDDQICF